MSQGVGKEEEEESGVVFLEIPPTQREDTKGSHSNDLTHQNKFGVTCQLTNRVRCPWSFLLKPTSQGVDKGLSQFYEALPRNTTRTDRLSGRRQTEDTRRNGRVEGVVPFFLFLVLSVPKVLKGNCVSFIIIG